MGKFGQIAIHPLEGTPEGLRLVEFGNWAGRAVVAPVASWEALMGRMELDLGGIYFLKRPGRVMAGTAAALRPALEAIAADPSLADIVEVMVFVRRWGWKEAEELAYLANELRDKSLKQPGLVMHGVVPPLVRLRADKRVELEEDLDHVTDLLHECGFEWENMAVEADASAKGADQPFMDSGKSGGLPLVPESKPAARRRGRPPKEASKSTGKALPNQPDLFRVEEPVQVEQHTQVEEPAPVIGKYHLEKRDIKATMDIIDGRFVVRKGSQAKRNAYPSMADNYRKIRARLVEEGILVEAGEDHYVFTRDYAFDSASTSASVVNGAQTAGPRAWYDESNVSLRGIKNDHHSLHETHRKPKAFEEGDEDGDISASFRFDEQDDVLDEALDSYPPVSRIERVAVPVLLGNERLTPSPGEESTSADAQQPEAEPPTRLVGKYHLDRRGVNATMDIIDGRYVVRKGSQAKKTANPSMADNYRKIRARLFEEGVLVDAGEDVYVFTCDHAFDSSSTAASVVNGAQTAGPRAWFDVDNVSLRGIKNDHHKLHETHRKPKDESAAERDNEAETPVSLQSDEQENARDEALESQIPVSPMDRVAAPVLPENERMVPETTEDSTPRDSAQPEGEVPVKSEVSTYPIGEYRIIGKQVQATMDAVPGGFLVRRGSRALNKVHTTLAKHYLDLRADMVAKGVLVPDGEGFYEFTQDYLFSSVSAASNIVLSRQTDGWISWRDRDGNYYSPKS